MLLNRSIAKRLHPATQLQFQIAVLSALGNNDAGLSLTSGVYLMAIKIQAALRAAALVSGFAIVTGCMHVTVEQLDAVKATAEAAQNAANGAQRTATQAQQAASGAQSTANQALQAAQAAQACCDATNQRLDRMFEQSQAK
jgi:Alanine-zipper, major outer membrane lipoprotein